ncbi:DNA polymerase ligase N-terminal domain-containing protein [Acidisphaera sp. L21]|uniref:DNA polymerase ligase N-terminal domain-containing protein n=1 Tax=Acidisphaera sp. L21 TaxID=1641851 RepID=UPI00131AA9AA|nr:DNA polymerase ligase N-terminal domain-containing protein [Acidisphaera sp. L21]
MAERAVTGSRIAAYKAERGFSLTSEPAPRREADTKLSTEPMFVIQKHQAHRAGLHYDFRLEHGGVLWSWAVREGPSLDPADRRIAVHVEDHPLDYASFQGRIPDGQYGAGTVETWDSGTWKALEDPEKGMKRGSLRFELRGQRLHGRFTLARVRRDARKQEGWFLIKGHDEFAWDGVDALSLERDIPLPTNQKQGRQRAAVAKVPPASGAVLSSLQAVQEPQLCMIAETAPTGAGWVSEIKFDGYRLLVVKDGALVRLLTRNGRDWSARMPSVTEAIANLPVQSLLMDGELVSLREDRVSSFPGLQAALKAGHDDKLDFYAFDLVHVDGWDLKACTLLDRKRVLHGLPIWKGMLRYSDHHPGEADAMRTNASRPLHFTLSQSAPRPGRYGASALLQIVPSKPIRHYHLG